ncbi:hypothetical protein [Natrinema sp. DC36]|uniref:hypothetical protein n=1 Tax=Natrinema sp. DC36 TaxID=2878680 RepID=UPI001CEFEDF2|nr:hypothetical protein [Natrinema sp. DC36]
MSDGETSHGSKTVMMRAEQTDEIRVETLGACEVLQRIPTYYGPKLRIEALEGDGQYLLHAPGPNGELQLLATDATPLRRVRAELVTTKQYDICLECGEPLKTVEHRRRSFIGAWVGQGEA